MQSLLNDGRDGRPCHRHSWTDVKDAGHLQQIGTGVFSNGLQ